MSARPASSAHPASDPSPPVPAGSAPPLTPAAALERIRRAAEVIRPHALRTPTLYSHSLSQESGRQVWVKLEMLQRTGAFKVRGALNKLAHLSAAERERGVIAASAGNHAQGVGLAAQVYGAKATIVMPLSTPTIKVERTRAFGAEIVLHGEHYDAAYDHALGLAEARGMTMVHPFDDLDVIAGQGTLALEIFEDLPELDALVVPVGGGGLIAGVALAARALRPGLRVYGVQAEGAAPMVRSFEAGRPVAVERPETLADGIRVGRVGRLTWPLVQAYVDGLLTVSEDELAAAIVTGLEQLKTVAEGAGAAALAALRSGRLPPAGRVCVLCCGANIDSTLLTRVIEAGLANSGRAHALRLRTRDVPGTLVRIAEVLAAQGCNILDIDHHRQGWKVPVGFVEVEILLETRRAGEGAAVDRALRAAGFEVR